MNLKPCYKWDDISSSFEACITDINIWMNSTVLKVNRLKTELIVFSSNQHVKKTENLRITVASSYLNITMPVSNLGLTLDKPL